MDEVAQKTECTKEIARSGCSEEEWQLYEKRIARVLEHIASAKAYILASKTDADR